jgi:hypothetical protein
MTTARAVRSVLCAAVLAALAGSIQNPTTRRQSVTPPPGEEEHPLVRPESPLDSGASQRISAGGALKAETRAALVETYGRLPLTFEANQGQTDAKVAFLARGKGYALFLTHTSEAVLSLRSTRPTAARTQDAFKAAPASSPAAVLRVSLAGADKAAKVTGIEPQPGRVNYLFGNDPARWRTGVPHYAKVRYESVYPGIDLEYYGNQGQLEFDFVVHPGADPGRIGLEFEGAERVATDPKGDLVLGLGAGEVRQHRPVVYQEGEGGRETVEGSYVVADNRVAFQLGPYDPTRPVVIDPVLVYSTFLGGSRMDWVKKVAVDGSGRAYLTGDTMSTDFPVKDAIQPTYGGGYWNAFVTRLNASGTALEYSTYLAGSQGSVAYGIAVDGEGHAYVTGRFSGDDFPMVDPLFTDTCTGEECVGAFVSKVSADGSALVYSTYFPARVDSIAADPPGNVYLTGYAGEFDDLPTVNALQSERHGKLDAFVTTLSPDGSAVLYSTFLGGSLNDVGNGIAVDETGNIYVVGYTLSTDFPTVNAFQPALANPDTYDGFVAKLTPDGSALVYSTYLGGSRTDYANGIAADNSGNTYVTGSTDSKDFPTVHALFASYPPPPNAFVAKLDPAGSVVYSTYLGGRRSEGAYEIAVDASGQACVAGATNSPDFPVADAIQPTWGGGWMWFLGYLSDAFVTKLTADGSALVYSTYLGGSDGSDSASGIAVDPFGNVYVVGYPGGLDFPLKHPLQGRKGTDGFVTRISSTFSTSKASFLEGDAGTQSVEFDVTLAQATSVEARLDYATADGTARAGQDYAATSGTITFSPGETVQTIAVEVNGDTTVEPNENFFVDVSSPDGLLVTTRRGVGTIVNDDPVPSLQFSTPTYAAREGSAQAVIAVTRTGAAQPPVTVDYVAAPGTASAPEDFVAVAGTLTFKAGQVVSTFTVPIVNDTLSDPGETVDLTLTNPAGGAVLGVRQTALLTIADDDLAGSVQFSGAAYTVSEAGPEATITLTRGGGLASGVTVDFETANGTATEGSDYVRASGTMSFGAGQTRATFAVPILEDTLGEGNETVLVSLSNPTGGATLGARKTATLTIGDNERVLQFAAATYRATESAPRVVVTVTRSGLLTGRATVEYVTSDGTASAGVDYQARAGTLTFGPNVLARTIVIPIVKDTLDETDETLFVRLTNPVDGALGPVDTTTLTIADDDTSGVVQFSAAGYSLAENRGSLVVSVIRSGGAASNVTVDYATSDGTATAGLDYTSTSGALSFGPGATLRTFSVPVTNDTDAEGNETVNLVLSNPTGGATLGGRSSAVVTMQDND